MESNTQPKKSYTNILISIICIIVYLFSFIYNDSYSITVFVSVFAIYILLFKIKNNKKDDCEIKAPTIFKFSLSSSFVIACILFEFISSYIIRVYYNSIFFFGSIKFGNFEIVDSFVVIVEIILVIIYYIFINKINLFVINKKVLMVVPLILLPFIFRDSIQVFSDIFTNNSNYSVVNCLNLAYRAFILAAVLEELFYRGMIYDELKKYTTVSKAQIIQAFLFMAAHSIAWLSFFKTKSILVMINLFMVFTLGVCNAKLREKTKSIIPSILLHGASNAGTYYLIYSIVISLKN